MQQTNDTDKIIQENRLREKMSKIKYKFIVISGKGGVGKTTIAVNLAYALALSGAKTGILDTDIHGPNIAKMLGIEGEKLQAGKSGIEPSVPYKNLKAVSLALLGFNPQQPIIWRGPMKTGAIKQLLSDTNWGKLDYLIIDSPPGTGDEPLSVCQFIENINGSIIVTTPQEVANLDAGKTVIFAKQLNVPIVGIVENMSGFKCPHCGKEINIFKKDGGRKTAENLKIPFLGSIPIDSALVELSDKGIPFINSDKANSASIAFKQIIKQIENFAKDKQ